MTRITEQTLLDHEITLYDRAEMPLTVRAIALSLTHQAEQLTDCHLTLRVHPETYQHIETQALFRLLPGVRGNLSEQAFKPDLEIEIETKLHPNLRSLLDPYCKPDEAASHLVNLCQQAFGSPLQSTESWLGLHVKQIQDGSEVGYRTFWAYASENVIAQETIASGQIFEEMESFFKQEWDGFPDDLVETAVSEFLEELNQAVEEWVDESVTALAEATASELVEEITQDLETWVTSEFQDSLQQYSMAQPIFQAMLNFFQEDDWCFTKIKGQPTLRMAFRGNSDQWTCYAKAREEQQQFVFYSVCPISIPGERQNEITEFLTRVNCGMTIGNFEFDYNNNEIRYKTSIDVSEDRLTSALIKQLVYINVAMMNEYLPGIKAVLAGQIPKVVVSMIEQEIS
jgi:hypothetical protein